MIMYVIGANKQKDSGLNHSQPIETLTKINVNNENITKAYCGNEFTIFSNSNHSNIWAAGNNTNGQCSVNEKQKNILNLTPIDYFKKHNIQIKTISVGCNVSFYITNQHKLYGSGNNLYKQLGHHDYECFEPKYIKQLENVIDVKAAAIYSLALCVSDNHKISTIIINYWCQFHKIPVDIIQLIICYNETYIVYSTGSSHDGAGHGYGANKNRGEWYKIERLINKNIIKIATGEAHSLFISSNGNIYGCGNNDYGCLGVGGKAVNMGISKPMLIRYFVNNKIKIKDVKCGSFHTLTIDW
eukprot:191796_1